MEELEKRLRYFAEKYSMHVLSSRNALAQDIAAKKQSGQGIANSRSQGLEQQLFRDRFHGWEDGRKDYTGNSYQKGYIGICVEYFSTHPEELTDDTIRQLCSKFEAGKERYIQNLIASVHQAPFMSEETRNNSAGVLRNGVESTLYNCKADLVLALHEMRDKQNYEQRTKKADTIMNNTVNNGFIVVGDHNTVNAQFRDLFEALDTLQAKIKDATDFTPAEMQDVNAEITTLKAQLAKSNPDKSRIMQAWECVNVLVTGKGLYDLLLPITPLIMEFVSKITG
jgi:hypothetical protein